MLIPLLWRTAFVSLLVVLLSTACTRRETEYPSAKRVDDLLETITTFAAAHDADYRWLSLLAHHYFTVELQEALSSTDRLVFIGTIDDVFIEENVYYFAVRDFDSRLHMRLATDAETARRVVKTAQDDNHVFNTYIFAIEVDEVRVPATEFYADSDAFDDRAMLLHNTHRAIFINARHFASEILESNYFFLWYMKDVGQRVLLMSED